MFSELYIIGIHKSIYANIQYQSRYQEKKDFPGDFNLHTILTMRRIAFSHQNTSSNLGQLDVRKPTRNELLVTVFNSVMGLTVQAVSPGNNVSWT